MVGPMVNNDLFIFLPLPFKPQKSESKFCSHTHFENNMTSVSMAANKLNVSWKTKSRRTLTRHGTVSKFFIQLFNVNKSTV